MRSCKLWIQGRVQGVWYRASAKKEAETLGIYGYIENEPDGSVYAEAEGDPIQLDHFIKWCNKGSQFAVVQKVVVEDQELQGFKDFEIRR